MQAEPVAGAGVHATPPGIALAVYRVIAELPDDAGADHETASWPGPAVVVTPVGGPGRPSLPLASFRDSHWKAAEAVLAWAMLGAAGSSRYVNR